MGLAPLSRRSKTTASGGPTGATPSTRLAVERMPSFAPNTAARSQPMRPTRCYSSLIAFFKPDMTGDRGPRHRLRRCLVRRVWKSRHRVPPMGCAPMLQGCRENGAANLHNSDVSSSDSPKSGLRFSISRSSCSHWSGWFSSGSSETSLLSGCSFFGTIFDPHLTVRIQVEHEIGQITQ